jgi:hypothetical protein
VEPQGATVKKIQKGMWEVSGGGTEAAECSAREGEGEGADSRMQVAPTPGEKGKGGGVAHAPHDRRRAHPPPAVLPSTGLLVAAGEER